MPRSGCTHSRDGRTAFQCEQADHCFEKRLETLRFLTLVLSFLCFEPKPGDSSLAGTVASTNPRINATTSQIKVNYSECSGN